MYEIPHYHLQIVKKAPSEILSLGGFIFLFVFTLRTPFIIVISYLTKTKGLIVNCIYLFYNFLCGSLTFYHCSYEEIQNEMKIKSKKLWLRKEQGRKIISYYFYLGKIPCYSVMTLNSRTLSSYIL